MYIIVGANGFLGAYIRQAICKLTDERILAVGVHTDGRASDARTQWMKCDVTDFEAVEKLNELAKQSQDNKVIYLAAYHHPDLVEKHPRHAWNVNVTALSNFINVLENVKCFFYPSTDSVYGDGGIDKHFKETDEEKPVNCYGRQKVMAEKLVTAYGYNVVRFPFLIAPSLVSHKEHFYDQIAEKLSKGQPVEMFSDSLRSSLDFGTVAELLIRLTENYRKDMPQILNVSGDDDLSKYDIGVMIARKLGVSTDLVVPISADKTEGIFEAKRAKSTLMDNTAVKKYLGLGEIKINL